MEVTRQLSLRYVLNEWDPIGVSEIASDEYDCLIGPLLVRLRAGAGRAEISEYLWFEVEDQQLAPAIRYHVVPRMLADGLLGSDAAT